MKVFAEGLWSRPPKIVLGVDIGTTQTAVSFAYLYPGGPQALHRVTAWPGQKSQKEESKVPTLVYYDTNNDPVSFGAEALKPTTLEMAEDEKWQLARHFKMHLHPESMRQKHNLRAQPLPTGVSLFKVYTDFMVYLLQHTKRFFESRVIQGQQVWSELHKEMTIVLAHPNGWGVKEQHFLRKAAVAARFVPSEKAIPQVRFVSEAEASVHFCMFHGDLYNRFSPATTFIVCDAGGSTIDTTAYSVKSTYPMLELEEKKASACVQAGGVFVDLEFETYLTRSLNGLDRLHSDERMDYIKRGVKDFEEMAKREFEDVDSEHRIDLGAGRLSKPELRIQRGGLNLEDTTIKSFFDNCVTQIVASVRQQMSGLSCKHILLVGGFGDSPYLRKALISDFGSDECAVNIANDSTAKAVADGAVIWYAKLSVISRATRAPYGVGVKEAYDTENGDHIGRFMMMHDAGYQCVDGKWFQLVDRGVVMSAEEAVRERCWRSYKTSVPNLDTFTVSVFTFTKNESPGDWLRDKNGDLNSGFEEVCVVEAEMEGMRQALTRRTGQDGSYYWHLRFNIALQFCGTELQAFIEWKQGGEIHTGQASILPGALTNAYI